jgi:hypothetical protein
MLERLWLMVHLVFDVIFIVVIVSLVVFLIITEIYEHQKKKRKVISVKNDKII